ncbi:MAG: TetR/AcrR family transcriptional regulator [Gemmatimonadales bacterium]
MAVREQESQILEAARDLILEGGIEAISMRAVADRVGVSATALYHYFASKQDLVDRVSRRAFEAFDEAVRKAAEQQPEGSIDRIRAIGEAYIRFAFENEAYFRVIFGAEAPDPRAIEDLPGGGGYPVLRQAVVRAMESGQMRSGDPDISSVYLWSLVHGLVTLYLACRIGDEKCQNAQLPGDPQVMFAAFGDLLAHGLRAPDPKGP